MGGWDYYCALCGGPLGVPYFGDRDNPEESDDEDGYDPAVLSSEEDPRLEWTENFKVVSEFPLCYNKNVPEGWISGPCSKDQYGDANVSLPKEDSHITGQEETEFNLNVYDIGSTDDPYTVPFHDACHSLLLTYMGKEKLDADVFYETTKLLAGDSGSRCSLGDLDYGDAGECMEQYWCTLRGTEWLIMSPVAIPELSAFFNDLPELDQGTELEVEMRGPSHHDPFSSLAPELMIKIISSLSLKSMGNFRLASRVARNTGLGNHFWKQKVLSDMSWLFDIPEAATKSTDVDWKRIYGRLLYASRAPSKTVMPGLANRRRIWKHMLSQIAPVYLEALAIRQVSRAGEPEAFTNSRSTDSAILVHPEPKDSRSSTVALLQTPHMVEMRMITIGVCFNKAGEISDLKVLQTTNSQILSYETKDVHRFEEVTIPGDSWIMGFIVTTGGEQRRPVGIEFLFGKGEPRKVGETGEGGKRLIHIPHECFIVGFRLHTSKKEDLLCRLGLIYHQSWRAGSAGSVRVWNNNARLYNLDAAKYLWHNELPKPSLIATEPYNGYWSDDMHTETSAFEFLSFPFHYQETPDWVAIAADVQFGGFEIRYANRPTRSIGPKRQAMKVLEIDGKGGERIATVHVSSNHIPTSIRIVTDRGRQLVIGQPDEREKRLPEEVWSDGDENPVTGIFGYWQNRDPAKASMDAVGALYNPEVLHGPIADVSRQIAGLVWEPAPPASMKPSGPVIGAMVEKRRFNVPEWNVPEDCTLLSWLGFSRPVSHVRVTLCHSLNTNQIPLVGIQLRYADGQQEIASIGPNEFIPPTGKGTTASGQHWCWCQLAVSVVKEEREQAPHYQHVEWDAGGQKLSALRIFMAALQRSGDEKPLEDAEGKVPTAMQFVAEDGTESPVCGYWGREDGGEEVQEIKFEVGKAAEELELGDIVGVKFFVGTNNRAVTRVDHTVQAFQALEKSSATS